MNNLLVAENVSKKYGDFTALNQLSIEVPKQSIFGILGPNGAGKTTFIRIINQITMPDTGKVWLDNEPLQAHHIQYIGYLPEERGLYKSMKVGEQVLYLAQLKGLSKAEAKKRLKFWFERLEIGDWWNKKIQELSKGMAQKIQFIVTVLHRPKLLIFDEPFSGFDPVNANLIRDEILKLRDEGATILFSTHRMESVEELCDYMALIHKSNKLLDGKVSTIKKQFKSNTYEVGIEVGEAAVFKNLLQEKFQFEETFFHSIHHDLQLNIKIKEAHTQNDLLQFLMAHGRINHFKEVIPSVSDIFIKTITSHA
ncbi:MULTISPECIES: ABC transporter ATP-binding protein [Mesonia]|uniref:ABC transporter ATP-binding protein NatA n=1 Tax=Mesonia oceanica TaxID=2687242 RepID=A0AC61YDB1_9FLAO|nr:MULTISPECIES: ATP-binding cassette domain-containing protein [Mesonia]MAN28083.1 ABC transporter ATP-binding protein [Mesonia sp.]MAQ39779.1 ABC transporter ATP-binding protein [Mesonia sp.]MBJ98867.1 ABC transporter ATP-binding protein [Flavobacteriaceae bacterium]VVV02506.1 ABC transporter ATP-binding protein NatA [Mesonia oceanica]|tara:strand:+ start:10251 stop:11180 length:930 start_codon:yes stop_codon:yes gene_type:complete